MDDLKTSPQTTSLSRRGLFTATAVGAFAVGAFVANHVPAQPSGGSAGGGNTPSTVGVRRNIYALLQTTEGRATVEAYRRGVAAMKAKPFSDPTSWRFQAAMHLRATAVPGVNHPLLSDDPQAEFDALPPHLQGVLDPSNQCQHGAADFPFFVGWHRMYVHFLEKHVRKASGDSNFMLPYWNYSDSTAERIMPEPFRAPADQAGNALFEPVRSEAVNNGTSLPAEVVSTSTALSQANAIESNRRRGFYTNIEFQPHNAVHGRINGFMGHPRFAALDPIFWMHHCNIDRLWAKWIRDGHSDPTADDYLNKRFSFIDDDGSVVSLTVREVIDTAAQLNYTYDDDAGPEIGFIIAQDGANDGVEGGQVPAEIAAANQPITFGREPLEVEAAPLVEAAGAALFTTDVSDPTEAPVTLVFEGLRHDDTVPVFYEFYVNRPSDAPAEPGGPYYVGNYYPFAATGEAGMPLIFDITGLMNRQVAAGVYESGPLKIEIIPTLPDTGGLELGPPPDLTVERIVVRR